MPSDAITDAAAPALAASATCSVSPPADRDAVAAAAPACEAVPGSQDQTTHTGRSEALLGNTPDTRHEKHLEKIANLLPRLLQPRRLLQLLWMLGPMCHQPVTLHGQLLGQPKIEVWQTCGINIIGEMYLKWVSLKRGTGMCGYLQRSTIFCNYS